MLPFDATAQLRLDGAQIIDAAERTGFAAPVGSCPGWDMGDLLWHVSEVWTFWAFVVENHVTDETGLQGYATPERLADDLLVDWAAAAHTGLFAALTDTPPTTGVWTWTGANRDVWWVRRRMAHETAVHRWDAERVVGDPYDLPTEVAIDGIDEFLEWFAPRRRTEPLGGTVHLHSTDPDVPAGGEWMVHRLDRDGIELERTHAKGDAAVRGRASDLLLWLWGRDAGPVEILGDRDVALRLRDTSDRS
jgi:uncharacterized protein (TIGR03083 family)